MKFSKKGETLRHRMCRHDTIGGKVNTRTVNMQMKALIKRMNKQLHGVVTDDRKNSLMQSARITYAHTVNF